MSQLPLPLERRQQPSAQLDRGREFVCLCKPSPACPCCEPSRDTSADLGSSLSRPELHTLPQFVFTLMHTTCLLTYTHASIHACRWKCVQTYGVVMSVHEQLLKIARSTDWLCAPLSRPHVSMFGMVHQCLLAYRPRISSPSRARQGSELAFGYLSKGASTSSEVQPVDISRMGQRPSARGGTYVMGYVDEEGEMHAPGGGRKRTRTRAGAVVQTQQQCRPGCRDLRHPLHS